jgi:DNA-binding MarR family transcriptional regulator
MPDDLARIRELLERATLASVRYRLALSQRLGLDDDAMAALLHLAQHAPLTTGELSVRLVMTPRQAMAALERLERRGYVSGERDLRDPGIRAYALTEEAAGEIALCGKSLVDGLDAATRELSEHERAAVTRFMDKIVAVTEHARDARAHEAIEGAGSPGQGPPPAPGDPWPTPLDDANAEPSEQRDDADPRPSKRRDDVD